MDSIDLGKILKKCKREDDVEEDDQPLHIDDAMESIACSWCPGFKGSIEVRVINQHTSRAKSHKSERKRKFSSEFTSPMKGVKDIRTYMNNNN